MPQKSPKPVLRPTQGAIGSVADVVMIVAGQGGDYTAALASALSYGLPLNLSLSGPLSVALAQAFAQVGRVDELPACLSPTIRAHSSELAPPHSTLLRRVRGQFRHRSGRPLNWLKVRAWARKGSDAYWCMLQLRPQARSRPDSLPWLWPWRCRTTGVLLCRGHWKVSHCCS